MRTNIDIDDSLMSEAMKASGAPTKKAVVEEALHLLVNLRSQRKVRTLWGTAEWQGSLDSTRGD